MQFLLLLLLAGIAANDRQLQRTDPVPVRAVFDGDTIDVATYGRVRLLGIDAPEIGRGFDTAAPFGREARDRLAALVLHRWVRLEHERQGAERDTYNRRLAYVIREDGLFVNAAMVQEGLARVTARLPLVRLGELQRAEKEARRFRRGMWGAAPSIADPTERTVAPKQPRRYTSPLASGSSKAHRKKKES